ncbi:hATC-domain-containing protein [Cylindrobasidium torrendii FP15055 ss-10]|uniref:HATC-domain-containing protein n=1 Tax=Cylindrobasidium torrendii FP15055 ss-10 TaxID=1314674 RepID=A0A0D7AS12_9AGAR|nr:hATC-domain-containing protein [Cylindrobasidium torrendii FP15055 ss-10]
MFASSRNAFAPATGDELERFLSLAPENVPDVIQWWIDNCRSYPRLSRMALDYHTIPATSVAVERVFSRARRVLNWERNRLSPQTTRALMCLGTWSLMGYVHDDDLAVIAQGGRVQPTEEEEELSDVDLEDGFDVIDIASDDESYSVRSVDLDVSGS